MSEVLKQIGNIGIVPVIVIKDIEKAVPLAKALVEGGIPAAEVTFRVAGADKAIAKMAAEVPEMLVGAGTVLTLEQCKAAIEAGAKFIVSPNFDEEIVDYCIEQGVVVTPGVATPSEMGQAVKKGLDVVKFFPAEQAGGVNYLKAVSGPFTKLKFMTTGGISPKNMNDYLSFKKVVAVGGSWMVKADMIEAGDFAGITAMCKEAVRQMHGFEVRHVGINCDNEEEAEKVAKTFGAMFGFEYKPGNSSIFSGTGVEVLKSQYLGAKGHIAIACNDVDRAVAYFEGRGITFNMESARYAADGKTKAIYFEEEVGGFAIHLLQK